MKLTYFKLLTIITDQFGPSILGQLEINPDTGKSRRQPFKFTHAIDKNVPEMVKHVKFYNEQRSKLLKDCCELDEKGEVKLYDEAKAKKDKKQVGSVIFKSKEDEKRFAEEHLSLLNEKVEVLIHQVTPETMERFDEMGGIEQHIVSALRFMRTDYVEEPDPEPTKEEVDA